MHEEGTGWEQVEPVIILLLGPMEPAVASGFVGGFISAVAGLLLTSEDGRPLFNSNTHSAALEHTPTLYHARTLRVNAS